MTIYYTVPGMNFLVEVIFRDDTVWLIQKEMSLLFGASVADINKNLKKAYTINEISKVSTIAHWAIVQQEGNRYMRRTLKYYNFDAILSVGYRINPKQATQFRLWATKKLTFQLLQRIYSAG